MKKTILGLAFLAIASVSFGAMAQDKKDKSECKDKTECVAKDKKCCKGEKGDKARKAGKVKDGKKAAARQMALFEGVNLTTEQKGKLEALNSAVKVSRKEIKDKAKAARESGDTTFNVRQAQKDLRKKYVEDLGEILGSDQMVVYLTNYYVNTGGNKGAKKMAMQRVDRRGAKEIQMRKDFRGREGAKGMRQGAKLVREKADVQLEQAK